MNQNLIIFKRDDELKKIFDELWREIRKWKRKNKESRDWMKKEFERHERMMKQIHNSRITQLAAA